MGKPRSIDTVFATLLYRKNRINKMKIARIGDITAISELKISDSCKVGYEGN